MFQFIRALVLTAPLALAAVPPALLAVPLALLAAPPVLAGPDEPPPRETRDVMRGIFTAFVALMGRADSGERFADPAAREEILGSLRAIRAAAEELEEDDLTAAHLSVRRSLADDATLATDAFVDGRTEGARFLVAQMAEDCFGCHSKLPTEHAFGFGKELMDTDAVRALPPERRAVVAVAARRFEHALDLYEGILADRSLSAVQIALSGVFENYFKVALRVLDDRPRALRALEIFRERGDLPVHLGDEVEAWVEALRAVPATAPTGLPAARQAVREGQLRTDYPGDRRGLVQFVLASRVLHRYVRSEPDDPEALAEAFYLLGLCETHISPSLWLNEAEDFLESAVRAAPGSPHARRAYATLESVWIAGFTGSSGTHLPVEVERRLQELRGMVEGG